MEKLRLIMEGNLMTESDSGIFRVPGAGAGESISLSSLVGMRVCLVKGFAVQILSSENNKLDRICEDILAKNYDAYFWDGDFFREDSFTRVIRDIFLVELPKGKSVTAFKSMDKASFVTAVDYVEIELDKTVFFSFGHADAQLPNFASIAVIPLSIPTANVGTLFYAKLGQLALDAVLAQSQPPLIFGASAAVVLFLQNSLPSKLVIRRPPPISPAILTILSA